MSLVLSGLPSRNLLSIQGDFNTQLASSRPWVGPCACHRDGDEQISRDHRDMLDILMRFDLTVLNSWACRRPHTYVHSSHYTMIDYIITRRSQASGRAKQSKPVHDDTLTGWRESFRSSPNSRTTADPDSKRPTNDTTSMTSRKSYYRTLIKPHSSSRRA